MADRREVIGRPANNDERRIEKSSEQDSRYYRRWYNRPQHPEDPWVSIENHADSGGEAADILYGGAGYSGDNSKYILPDYNGANVWINYNPNWDEPLPAEPMSYPGWCFAPNDERVNCFETVLKYGCDQTFEEICPDSADLSGLDGGRLGAAQDAVFNKCPADCSYVSETGVKGHIQKVWDSCSAIHVQFLGDEYGRSDSAAPDQWHKMGYNGQLGFMTAAITCMCTYKEEIFAENPAAGPSADECKAGFVQSPVEGEWPVFVWPTQDKELGGPCCTAWAVSNYYLFEAISASSDPCHPASTAVELQGGLPARIDETQVGTHIRTPTGFEATAAVQTWDPRACFDLACQLIERPAFAPPIVPANRRLPPRRGRRRGPVRA
jgi:hypothetical protein